MEVEKNQHITWIRDTQKQQRAHQGVIARRVRGVARASPYSDAGSDGFSSYWVIRFILARPESIK